MVRQGMFFDIGSSREFHESESQQHEALRILRVRKLTKRSFEQDWPGSRLAPAIDMLKNGWGFDILGHGTSRDPYWLINPRQSPTKVMTTEKLKDSYYETDWWKKIRNERYEHDNHRCVLCVGPCREELQCHHITYDLFGEKLDHLMTVCKSHHDLIHDRKRGCKLKFPTGVETWVAERLLGIPVYSFAEWLLP